MAQLSLGTILKMENKEAPCYGKRFGHNYAGGACLFCGQSQTGASVKEVVGMKPIKFSKPKKTYTSEMQMLIDEIRTEFLDTALKGLGSFAFYGVLIKRVGIPFARDAFYKSKSSGSFARSPKRLFVWMLKEEWKRIKAKQGV